MIHPNASRGPIFSVNSIALTEGVYAAFAYGSRGIIWSALAAEIIAAELEGEPLPVEASLARALEPGRFKRRAESRGSRP